MERKKQKEVVGTISIDEAIAAFANSSKENFNIISRVEIINELIEKISNERVFRGLSQRQLAEISGIKQPMIARFEKAEMMPRLDTFVRIASSLDLELKLVRVDDYSRLSFDNNLNYVNDYKGEEIYGFTKSKEYGYQA